MCLFVVSICCVYLLCLFVVSVCCVCLLCLFVVSIVVSICCVYLLCLFVVSCGTAKAKDNFLVSTLMSLRKTVLRRYIVVATRNLSFALAVPHLLPCLLPTQGNIISCVNERHGL
jgi:hypothetical protein